MRCVPCVFRLVALCSLAVWPVAGLAQFTQQGPKLVANDAIGSSVQGVAVALSADGNTAIVGGLEDDTFVGAAWVWTRSGGAWTQQGPKLVGTGAVGLAQQGTSVALSADGNTAIVGGPRDLSADLTRQLGAAWVFTRSGGTWTQQGPKLVGTGAIGFALQGSSVALSADGNTAIVGGIYDNGSIGATWVFTRSGGTWTQQGPKLVGTGAVSALCGGVEEGFSVALSADGNTAIVGGDADNGCQGAAWIFTRSGTTWTQQGAKLVGTGGSTFAHQGTSVAISGDGNTALIGGPGDPTGAGAAWVFTRSGTIWTQQGPKLVGSGFVNAAEGTSVGLSGDGNTAILGGPHDTSDTGAVWVFTRSGATWTQLGGKLVGSGVVASPQQATSAAISTDGSTFISGGFSDDHYLGAAWVFAITADLSTSVTAPATVNAGQSYSYTIAVANGGPSISSSVTLTNTLPPGASFVSASGSGWTCGQAAGVVTCTSSLLAVGSANPITINVVAPANAGSLTDSASVSPVATDPNPANNTASAIVTVVATADLLLTKTASAASVYANAPVTYTLSLTNNGPSTATGVTIVDTLPAGSTFISASGTGWSCGQAGGVVTCTMAALAVGTAAPVSINITAPSSGASFVNSASVTSAITDPDPSNNSSSSNVALLSGSIPTLDSRTLLLLAIALAGTAIVRLGRSG